MKLSSALFSAILLIFLILRPTAAKPDPTTKQKLNELSNRISAFESNWNRLRIGGNLAITSNTFYNQTKQTLSSLNFEQELGLYLDAFLDRNLSTSLRLTHSGYWGNKYNSSEYTSSQMESPLQLDEAFLRLEYPTALNYLGRFRFSLSQLGLISDFYTDPVEGFSLQKTYRQFHGIILYSRVYTELQADYGIIEDVSAEDYLGLRLGWTNSNNLIGINLLPNGVTGERSFSLDWSHEWPGQKVTIEAAWYSFKPAPDSNVDPIDWVPGILVSYGRVLSKNNYLQLKGGYFGDNFLPSYSSLAHNSGDDREWFLPNSYGGELYLRNQLRPSLAWDNRILALKPVHFYDTSTDIYHFASYLTKSFSPVNQLQFGVEAKRLNTNVKNNRIFLSWNFQF